MLEEYLGPKTTATPEGQVISSGNTPDVVEICYVPPSPLPANWTPSAGDAVRVSLKERYRLQAIVGLAKVDLNAKATMRLEQAPLSTALPDRTDPDNWVLRLAYRYRSVSSYEAADLRDERGVMAVLFAIVLTVLLIMTALVWDAGNWWTHRKHLQTKADAAAFAGGQMWGFPCGGDSDARIVDEARKYVGRPQGTA